MCISRNIWCQSELVFSCEEHVTLINSHIPYYIMLVESLSFIMQNHAILMLSTCVEVSNPPGLCLVYHISKIELCIAIWLVIYTNLTMFHTIYRANLGWLFISSFLQYYSLLTLFHNYYLGKGAQVTLRPPILSGRQYNLMASGTFLL